MQGHPDLTVDPRAATTVGFLLERSVATYSERCAVVCGDTELSFAELGSRCRRLAKGLQDLGLQRGDRVAVVGNNCHRYLELYLGVPAAGMVIVPLNARLASAELHHALADSGARVLFTDRPGICQPPMLEISLQHDYEKLIGGASEPELPDAHGDTLFGLFYTSGTTGAAKGTMLTHANLLANAETWRDVWPFDQHTIWMLSAPMFHLAGTNAVLATLAGGGRHVVLPAFEAAAALDLVAEHAVTATLVVPTMLAAMAEEQLARPRQMESLRYLSHGGAPIATATLDRAHRAFPGADLMNIYGTTETAPNVSFLPHEQDLLHSPVLQSCGRAVRGAQIAIVDAARRVLPTGEVGEVTVCGPMVMRGYWQRPEATADALDDGRYWTGDLGRLDDEGHLYLVDRRKDMIVSGGENVYSTEVEEALYLHPNVLEAAVFGVPDDRWGEAVYAVVTLRASGQDPEDLREFCRARIAPFKVPKTIEILDGALPKSASGKILKRDLRDRFWSDRAQRIAGA